MHSRRLTRRSTLAALAGAMPVALGVRPALAAASATPTPTPASRPGTADPAAWLSMLVRMRGALDERLMISFLEGVYYGVMDARIQPLYGLSAGLFRQYRKRADGGYDYANFELVYVTDLETGELLEEFRNPYSGKTGRPPQTRLGPTRLTITPAMQVTRPGSPPMPPGSFHRFRPPRIVGDDVWIVEESAVQAPPPMKFAFNEVLTYRASLRDLADASRLHVPTDVQFNPVIGWRPWQGMDGYQGPASHVMGSCAGRMVTGFDELPTHYREWTARFHPDVFENPLQVLAGAWKAG